MLSVRSRERNGVVAYFFISWIGFVLVGRSKFFQDPGPFWHVLTGERILNVGLPYADWLTFSRNGEPWIAQQWLADCAMAALHRLGGWDALLLAASGTLALLFAWLFHRLISAGVAVRWAVLFTLLAVMTSAGQFHVRPLLLSLVFFGVTCATLVAYEAGRIGLGRLALLLPLFMLWVNVHGAALGAIASVGFCAAAWVGCWLAGWPSPVRSLGDACWLALFILGLCATALLNPYGQALPRAWFAIVASPVIPEVIIEHASIWRTGSWNLLPLGIAFAALLASARSLWRRPSAWLAVLWFVLALQRIRQAPLFAIVAVLVACELLAGRMGDRPLYLQRFRDGLPAWMPGTQSGLYIAAAALVALAALGAKAGTSGEKLIRFPADRWPMELIADLKNAEASAKPGAAILNDTYLGSFIAYHAPGFLVLSDDRCELFGDQFLAQNARGDPIWFEEWEARGRASWALAQPGSPLGRYLSSKAPWRLCNETIAARLYSKKGCPRSYTWRS